MSRRARWTAFACAVVLIGGAVLMACGVGGKAATSSRPEPERSGSAELSGWLATDATSVIYLDYREQSGALNGTLQTSTLKAGDLGWEVKGQSNAFTGSLEGTDLSIQVGTAPPWFGDLRGDRMTLNLPQNDGALAPVDLRPASVADFNNAVGELRLQAQRTNDQVAEAAREAVLQDETGKAASAFETALTELGTAGQDAGSEAEGSLLASYDLALVDYEAAWEEMQSAEAEMRSTDCLDVSFAADGVGFARDSVEFARDSLDLVGVEAETASGRIDTAITDAESAYDSAVVAANAASTKAPDRDVLDTMSANGREAQEGLKSRSTAIYTRADEIDAAADTLNTSARSWADSHGC